MPIPIKLFHFAVDNDVTAMMEEQMVNEEEISRRSKQGKIAAALAIAWWVASVGGIIWVINASA